MLPKFESMESIEADSACSPERYSKMKKYVTNLDKMIGLNPRL